jgi:hypothetical protein
MRPSTHVVLVMLALMTGAVNAAAQAPPPPAGAPGAAPPPAAPPAAPAPPAPPAAAPAPAPAAPPAPAPPEAAPAAPAAAPPAGAAPAAPAGPANWYDKFSADAFVDVYGNVDWNMPKPQYGIPLRAYDQAQGFAVNWIGLNGSYTADPIGGTISLRFGPAAALYNVAAVPPAGVAGGVPGSADNSFGMQNVRQAYATVKPADKVTLDAGKFDQPFGSEVPDSQLNMEYTRSMLFNLNQPVFFTGLRLDYAPADAFDAKLILANGWNNTIDNNRSKTIAAQVMLKPADQLVLYVGYAGGPEQTDAVAIPATGTTPAGTADVADANSHWRHLVDFVADINPTKELRFLINGDYDTEDYGPAGTASWYGANLAIRYIIADPFQATLRGEFFSDKHGTIVPSASGGTNSTTIESGTLTLSYVIASHYMLMLDNRIDAADTAIFAKGPTETPSKTQFTTTLGVIASTK